MARRSSRACENCGGCNVHLGGRPCQAFRSRKAAPAACAWTKVAPRSRPAQCPARRASCCSRRSRAGRGGRQRGRGPGGGGGGGGAGRAEGKGGKRGRRPR